MFNDRDTLDRKVAAVLDTGPEACQLIVVDDGSTDGTTIPTANDKRLTFLRLPSNVGRPRALLAGLRQAEAPVVLLDAECPEAGWRLDARRRAEGYDLAVAVSTRRSGPPRHWRLPVMAGAPPVLELLLADGRGGDIEAAAHKLNASVLWAVE